MASIGLDKHYIHAQLMRKRTFPCSGVQTSLVKWLRGYQAKRFGSFSCAYFRSNSVILSTVGFINEGNYCHSQRIGQLIKEKLLNGIFKVDWLINVAANTQISPSLLLTSAICKQMIDFFLHECFLEFFFFPEIMLECWGCGLYTSGAYTWVFTVFDYFL